MRLLLVIAASSIVLVASAIEVPRPAAPPATAPANEEPAKSTEPATVEPAETPAPAPVPEEEEELPPLPPDTVPAGPPPARFNPTEKVRADFPVSFPIDI